MDIDYTSSLFPVNFSSESALLQITGRDILDYFPAKTPTKGDHSTYT